jgi:hypothetical protein
LQQAAFLYRYLFYFKFHYTGKHLYLCYFANKLLATRFTPLKQKYILPIISLLQQHARLAASSLQLVASSTPLSLLL